MRILMVHNRYLLRAGEDVSTDTEVAMLRDAGHEVVLLEESNERIAEIGIVTTAARAVWSRGARSRVGAALDAGDFDVMHVQNFFPLLSPSVYGAAQRRGIGVVQSLRNFRLLCPAASTYRAGAICEDCMDRRFAWPGIVHACYRGSRAATAVVASMSAAHTVLGTFRNGVDVFVTPSEFARSKFVAAGWDGDHIEVVPNSVHPDPGVGGGGGDFALFAGRLETVKGIEPLLDAWQESSVDLRLKIVGEGPLLPLVVERAAADPRIEALGSLDSDEIHSLMGTARFVLMPSLWYETFGRVVAEAFASGAPVVVSNLGALPELVSDGEAGLIVEPGNEADLRKAIEHMADRDDLDSMRAAAREAYDRMFSGPANAVRLTAIYELAMSRARPAQAPEP